MTDSELTKLVLHERHAAQGARFAPFAGHEMPVRYGPIVEEHLATRSRAALFDVSHMGQVFVRGEGALQAVDRLMTNDIASLAEGRACYTLMCNEAGGIVDDLIVYHLAPSEVLICVNAACRHKDVGWMRRHLRGSVILTDESDAHAQLALQGPLALDIARDLMDPVLDIAPFGVARTTLAGRPVIAARTGYTGEDGYEFYLTSVDAPAVFDALREAGGPRGMVLAGLGARDTLRLEAKLMLYGSDMDEETNPWEAGLGWVVKLDRDEFIGRRALERLREAGPSRRLRGFIMRERGVLRGGYELWQGEERVGTLTSGSVAPSLDGVSIGLGYLDAAAADLETVDVEIRGRRIPLEVTRKPFYRRPRS